MMIAPLRGVIKFCCTPIRTMASARASSVCHHTMHGSIVGMVMSFDSYLWQMDIHLVPIKVSIVRCTTALVEAKGSPWHHLQAISHQSREDVFLRTNLGFVTHDRQLMQTWLSIEQHHISIHQVSQNGVPHLQFLCNFGAVTILQKSLETVRILYK